MMTAEMLVALINLGALGVVLGMIVRGDLRTRQEVETMQRIVDTLVPAIEKAGQTIREQTTALKELAVLIQKLQRQPLP